MREVVFGRVAELIDHYQLHQTGTLVKLTPLEDMFPIRYEPLARMGILGACHPPKSGEVSAANPARILLDDGMPDRLERVVYAHEVGHGILGHRGELAFGPMSEWFSGKNEREAWEVAAMLLVPREALMPYVEASTIAAICEVPEELVHLAARL